LEGILSGGIYPEVGVCPDAKRRDDTMAWRQWP